jgi:hypothetical protein
VVDSGEGDDIALGPSLGSVPLKIGRRDALRVGEIRDPRVVTGNAAVGVVASMDLKRPESLAAVADDRSVPTADVSTRWRARQNESGGAAWALTASARRRVSVSL